LLIEGSQLILNVNAEQGTVRVAILNEAGKPMDGFSLNDCDPIQVDDVEHRVTWQKRANIPADSTTAIKLKFELHDAKIYAMQFK
jgi:hypothetical protein